MALRRTSLLSVGWSTRQFVSPKEGGVAVTYGKLHVKKNRLLSPHDIHNELETLRDAHLSLQAHAEELLQVLQQQLETQTEAAEAAADVNHQLREHLNGLFVRESAFHGKQIQDCQ